MEMNLPNLHSDPVQVRSNPESQIPYGVEKIGAPIEWERSKTEGEYTKIAVIDTGAPEHIDIEVQDSFDGTKDNDGHGTHVAGIIAADGKIKGVAPKAQLYTAYGLTSTRDWVDIAEWVNQMEIDIVNISLGWPRADKRLVSAIDKMDQSGAIVVSSAGNSGDDGMSYPAKLPNVISVAAVDVEKQRPDFSSIGEANELCAAGVQVESCYLDDQYAIMSGTSMAAPHIAGAIALMQSKSKMLHDKRLTLNEVRAILHNRAIDLGTEGRNAQYGYGIFTFGTLKPFINTIERR